jgi:hypothetical protein
VTTVQNSKYYSLPEECYISSLGLASTCQRVDCIILKGPRRDSDSKLRSSHQVARRALYQHLNYPNISCFESPASRSRLGNRLSTFTPCPYCYHRSSLLRSRSSFQSPHQTTNSDLIIDALLSNKYARHARTDATNSQPRTIALPLDTNASLPAVTAAIFSLTKQHDYNVTNPTSATTTTIPSSTMPIHILPLSCILSITRPT